MTTVSAGNRASAYNIDRMKLPQRRAPEVRLPMKVRESSIQLRDRRLSST